MALPLLGNPTPFRTKLSGLWEHQGPWLSYPALSPLCPLQPCPCHSCSVECRSPAPPSPALPAGHEPHWTHHHHQGDAQYPGLWLPLAPSWLPCSWLGQWRKSWLLGPAIMGRLWPSQGAPSKQGVSLSLLPVKNAIPHICPQWQAKRFSADHDSPSVLPARVDFQVSELLSRVCDNKRWPVSMEGL